MPFNMNIFRGHDFSIHKKLETSIEIENVSEEDGPTVKSRKEFERINKKKIQTDS